MRGSFCHLACLLSEVSCWRREHRLLVPVTKEQGWELLLLSIGSSSGQRSKLSASRCGSGLERAVPEVPIAPSPGWLALGTASGCSGAFSELSKHPSRQMPSLLSKCTPALGCLPPLEVAANVQVCSLRSERGSPAALAASGKCYAVGSTLPETLPSFTKGDNPGGWHWGGKRRCFFSLVWVNQCYLWWILTATGSKWELSGEISLQLLTLLNILQCHPKGPLFSAPQCFICIFNITYMKWDHVWPIFT